ncbi:thioredoxin family protein [Patescibacteria group bacterium]
MTLTKSQKPEFGTPAPDFSLPATDGKTYALKDFSDKEVLVIIFTCNHCPYAQAAKPKLHDLLNEFKDKSVQFVAINPNDEQHYPEDDFDHMKKIEYDYPFPYLRDQSQEVAQGYSAVCTPDIFVFNDERKLVYHGQIDDDRPSLGAVAAKIVLGKEIKQDEAESTRDLAEAIIAILSRHKPDADQKPSLGCSIKWK